MWTVFGAILIAFAATQHLWRHWTEHGVGKTSYLALVLMMVGSALLAVGHWREPCVILLALVPAALAGWALWTKLAALLHTKWRIP